MSFHKLLPLLITALLGYVLGSLKTMNIASHYIFHTDIMRIGKRNAWISNFRRRYGIPGFLKLLAVEVIKNALPIFLGGLLMGSENRTLGYSFAGFCVTLGSLFPVFNRFRGNHAIVPIVLTALFMRLPLGLTVMALAVIIIWVSKYLTLSAVVSAAVLFGGAVMTLDGAMITPVCAFLAGIVILKHIPAMIRMSKGRETKLSFEEDISYKFDEDF